MLEKSRTTPSNCSSCSLEQTLFRPSSFGATTLNAASAVMAWMSWSCRTPAAWITQVTRLARPFCASISGSNKVLTAALSVTSQARRWSLPPAMSIADLRASRLFWSATSEPTAPDREHSRTDVAPCRSTMCRAVASAIPEHPPVTTNVPHSSNLWMLLPPVSRGRRRAVVMRPSSQDISRSWRGDARIRSAIALAAATSPSAMTRMERESSRFADRTRPTIAPKTGLARPP